MNADPGQTPALTVVVPTRGRPELVRRTVRGIVAQRYPGDIHTVVVHDQEPPDTGLVDLAGPGRTVQVIANDGDAGLAGSRNAGLAHVHTPLVASCDDDDVWLPDKVALQVTRLLAHPTMYVVGGGIRLLLPQDKVVDWLGPDDVVTQRDLFTSRRKELHSSTLLMRREIFDLAGDYDAKLPNSYAEDYEWLLRASRHTEIGVVRTVVAEITKNGVSWFPRERSEVVSTALQRVLDQHPELAGSRRGHARILGQIAFAEASLDRKSSARRWAVRALRRWPLAPQAGLALAQVSLGIDPETMLKTARLAGRGLS